MSDLQEWFESSSNLLNNQLTLVDSAGCEIGEIDRPGETHVTQEAYEIRVSGNPKAVVRTPNPVDLGDWE